MRSIDRLWLAVVTFLSGTPRIAAASEVVVEELWIPPVAHVADGGIDEGMTQAMERAIALFAPQTPTWQIGEPTKGCHARCLVVRITAEPSGDDMAYQLILSQGGSDDEFRSTVHRRGMTDFAIAQALVVKIQSLVLVLTKSTNAARPLPARPAKLIEPEPTEPEPTEDALHSRLLLGASGSLFTSLAGGEYTTFGPALQGWLRLAGSFWLTLGAAAHFLGAGEASFGEEDYAYEVRAFPISCLTTALWTNEAWLLGISGGVVLMPIVVSLPEGGTENEEIWGGRLLATVGYAVHDHWKILGQLGIIYHADEVAIEAASRGSHFRLPRPLATLELGVVWTP